MPTYIKTGYWDKKSKAPKEWLDLNLLITQSKGYKVYTAIYTQNGGANPVPVLVNVLENTITPGDTPIIDQQGAGIFILTFSSTVLTAGKTFVICSSWGDDGATAIPSTGYSGDTSFATFGNDTGYDNSNYIAVEIRVYS